MISKASVVKGRQPSTAVEPSQLISSGLGLSSVCHICVGLYPCLVRSKKKRDVF